MSLQLTYSNDTYREKTAMTLAKKKKINTLKTEALKLKPVKLMYTRKYFITENAFI